MGGIIMKPFRISLKDALELKKKKYIPPDNKVRNIQRCCVECGTRIPIIHKTIGQIVVCPYCGKEHILQHKTTTRIVLAEVDGCQ